MNLGQKLIRKYCEENKLKIIGWMTVDWESKAPVTVPADGELPPHPGDAAVAYIDDAEITQVRTFTAEGRCRHNPRGVRMYAKVNGKEKAIKWQK